MHTRSDNPDCFENCLKTYFDSNHCPADRGDKFFNCLFKGDCEGITNEDFHECYWDSGSKVRCSRALQQTQQEEKVRYVSMLMKGGGYEGIRLLASDQTFIMNQVWGDQDDSDWTELQEVPEGQQIIGFKVITFDETRITGLSFLLRPII